MKISQEFFLFCAMAGAHIVTTAATMARRARRLTPIPPQARYIALPPADPRYRTGPNPSARPLPQSPAAPGRARHRAASRRAVPAGTPIRLETLRKDDAQW